MKPNPMLFSAEPEHAEGLTELGHAPRFVCTLEIDPAAAAVAVPDKRIEKALVPEPGSWTLRFGKI